MIDPPEPNDSGSDDDGYDGGDTEGAPRWAKVFGLVLAVLVALFVVLHLTGVAGRHGPGGIRHGRSSGAAGGEQRP